MIMGSCSVFRNEVQAADCGFLQFTMATNGGTNIEELMIKQDLTGPDKTSKELEASKYGLVN